MNNDMRSKRIIFSVFIILIFSGCSYNKGRIEKEYYDDGKVKSETPYKDGKIDGEVREYFENGNLEGVITYRNGLLHGEVKLYREDGTLRQRHFNFDNRLSDKIEFFYPTGELQQVQFYDVKERLVDVWSYGKDGKRFFDIDILTPIIISDADTINFEEPFECRIKLGNSKYNWIDVVVCKQNDPNLLEKPTLPKLDSATALLRIKPEKEGDNMVEGYILEINKHYPDSLLPIYFQKKFYVRKQKPPNLPQV